MCVDCGYRESWGRAVEISTVPAGQYSLRAVTRTARRLSGLQGVSATIDNCAPLRLLASGESPLRDLNFQIRPRFSVGPRVRKEG